jgi:hypothetical protein
MRLRFSASDCPNQTLVEAGLDDFLAAQGAGSCQPCQPGAPDTVANSLRAAKSGATGARWAWESTSALVTPNWNLHATADKASLPGLYSDAGSVVSATTDSVPDLHTGAIPPGFYRAYGADGCTWTSVP